MKNKVKLLLTIIFTLGIIPAVAFQARADEPISMTVNADTNCDGYINDASQFGHIVYDLYEVDVTKITKEEEDDFTLLAQNELKKHIQDNASKPGTFTLKDEPKISGKSLGEKVSLDKGTYLLVARGVSNNNERAVSGQIETDIREVAKISGDASSASTQLASFIRLGANYFTVSPQLITAPIKIGADGKPVKYGNMDGTWVYDQNITLKMLGDPEYGSIQIDKSLTGYYIGQENATCIFQVDVYYPYDSGEPDIRNLYSSETYTVSFQESGQKSLTIGGIPLRAYVEIAEVYSGTNYVSNIEYPNKLNVVLDVDHSADEVQFTNTHVWSNGGGGVTNHFEYTDEGDGIRWSWKQVLDNVETTNGRIRDFFANITNPSN